MTDRMSVATSRSRMVLAPISEKRLNRSPSGKNKMSALGLKGINGMSPRAARAVSFPSTTWAVSEGNGRSSNNAAGLAATKLKLKLQLALYKVQQRNNKQDRRATETPPIVQKAQVSAAQQLPTPPQMSYSSSANINLKTKTSFMDPQENESASSLALATQLNRRRIQKLKLFQIKRDSVHYNELKNKRRNPYAPSLRMKSAPLLRSEVNLPRPLKSSDQQNPTSKTSLPPINKILKTPIKHSNSTRSLIQDNPDDTIDVDATLNTTIARKTQSAFNGKILSSSPTDNAFGTPNSFSVAKSLLQLGGYKS